LLPPLARFQDPLLGTSLQERSPIERDGVLQRGKVAAADRLVEREQVYGHPIEIESQRLRSGRAKTPGVGTEGNAKLGEGAAEAGEGLRLGEIGPEDGSEPGAFDRPWLAEDEESEQPVALADADTRERVPLSEGVEGTKEPD
jgi:hypothetical protein